MSSPVPSRPALAWARIRDSLWFVPSLAVIAGTLLAIAAVRLPTPRVESRFAWILWLFGGGAEGARGVLTAIAGSLITVTGTIFSVTIVALQLASSQFTPRLLRSFVADRVNQAVLGIFIGTFTYTLLVLRTIRSAADEPRMFVPQVGVSVALVLLMVSVGALIVYIDHAAHSIRASVILHRETQRTIALVESLYRERVPLPAPAQESMLSPDVSHAGPGAVVASTEAGYVQAIHAEALWPLGRGRGGGSLFIRAELSIGAFAFPGKPLASVWPPHAADEEVSRAIREAIVLGPERTPEQDVEFGIVELSDIALKALSPGINDPTTAIHFIDRLTQILAALGTRIPPASRRASPDGAVCLLMRGTSFDRAAGLAFDQIRHFGAGNPAITKRLLESLADLADVVDGDLLPTLEAQAEAAEREARRSIEDPADLATVEHLTARVLAPMRRRGERQVGGEAT